MKKVMKRSICCLVCFIMLLSLSSCMMFSADNRPEAQENSQWLSEDGNIFVKSENGYAYGYIILNDEKIPMQFFFNGFGNVYVNGYTSLGETIRTWYDTWSVSHYFKNYFVAKVTESEFFQAGEKIKFHKLNDDERIDYEPSSFSSSEGNIIYDNTVDKNADLIVSVIEGHITAREIEYEAHIMALGIQKYGIKEICSPCLMAVDDGFMTLGFTDGNGAAYYLTYSLSESMVTDFGEV